MRILIAEDEHISRHILSAILKKYGHEPVPAEDGIQAWEIMQADDAPQIAIIDWEMPGLNGLDLCTRVRGQDRKRNLYLILLTARKDVGDIVKGLESGADDYITKPYNTAELHARINAGCRMVELQNRVAEQEKLRGVLEMAGAICHEVNQPLQVVSGYSEILLMDISQDDPNYKSLKIIKEQIERVGNLTHKIMRISSYKTKPYLKSNIIDIDQATVNGANN